MIHGATCQRREHPTGIVIGITRMLAGFNQMQAGFNQKQEAWEKSAFFSIEMLYFCSEMLHFCSGKQPSTERFAQVQVLLLHFDVPHNL
jgi:hypothetical protein